MLVAICCPSRGLIHSRTMEACLWNIKQADVEWVPCFEHDKPIPDAQNSVTKHALAANADWLWFLEEDMIPPTNTLRTMLQEGKVISARYRNRGGTWAYSLDQSGRLQYAGIGCLVVHRSIFSALKVPYFDVISNWVWNSDGSVSRRNHIAADEVYGRQDVHFFAQLWQEGIEARLANIVCWHATVKRYGEPHKNKGCHEIEII